MHYYEWLPEENGLQRLALRTGVMPLPIHGVLHLESGGNLAYQLQGASKAMVDTIASFVETEFGGKRTGDNRSGESIQLMVNGIEVTVFNNESSGQVVVFLAHGSELSLIRRIAEKFDVELATGKYDAMFDFLKAER